MGKLIDADALLETIEKHCYQVQYDRTSIEKGMTLTGVRQAINEQPEAVVRCKDCKYYSVVKANIGILVEGCYFLKELSKYLVPRPHVYPVLTCADGYCSLGERRTDGTD